MIFSPINLKEELAEIGGKHAEDGLMAEVNEWLAAHTASDENVMSHFPNATGIAPATTQGLLFDVNAVYAKQAIKELCIKFRLRFLPSSFYAGTLPYEAVQAIKQFEAQFPQVQAQYHIVAPAEFFKLKDRYADPLLFADLGNGKYYLLHQWGADFKPYAPVLKYPFRNVESTLITAVGLGLLFTLVLFVTGAVNYTYLGQAYFRFISITVVSSAFVFISGLIYGLLSFSDFSDETWNSKYFN